MDQFDRHLRSEVTAMLAAREPRGFGLSRRRRGGIVVGLAVIVALVLAMLISGGSSNDDAPGLCAELEVTCAGGPECTPAELEQTRLIIESRVHTTGLAGPAALSHAPDRIEVVLPFVELGTEWADSLIGLISAVGILEFVPVPPELAGEVLLDRDLPAAMHDIEPILDGTGVLWAQVGEDEATSQSIVELSLDAEATAALDAHAFDHFGESFAIVLDGIVKSAPTINATRYGGGIVVSGGFTSDEAWNLVLLLRLGALPAEIELVSTDACSANATTAPTGVPLST